MADSIRCVAIIGAGFSGTVTAITLMRQSHERPLHILLIDRDSHARGVAYTAHPDPHLLNVPAGRMSAFSEDPLDFLRYAQRTRPETTAEDFLPRVVYGDYLQDSLSAAERGAAAHVRLDRVRGKVCSLELLRPAHTFIVGFENGQEMRATDVVLALGNPPPGDLPGADALRGSTRLVKNPWNVPATLSPDETVLLVGTGLTMADVVLSAMQTAHAPRQIYAISRHGLVPPGQTAFSHAHPQFDPLPLLQAAAVSTRQLMRLVRQISHEAEERGGDWREAITFVRTLAPRLWAKLPARERKRFLRHVRAYWDIHRHRLPPGTRAEIDRLREAKRLVVQAGRVLQLQPDGERIRVTWQPHGQRVPATLHVDWVVNCTGPDYRCRNSQDPLVNNLINTGLIQPDALQLGLQVSPAGGVLNITGNPTRGLHYIGPMLRAQHWEATAVQELREHAKRLAITLATHTGGSASTSSDVAVGAT